MSDKIIISHLLNKYLDKVTITPHLSPFVRAIIKQFIKDAYKAGAEDILTNLEVAANVQRSAEEETNRTLLEEETNSDKGTE